MTFSIRLRTLELPLRDPFVIARASRGEGRRITTVVAELRDDADGPTGPVGLGEGYPDAFYGDTPETMAAVAPVLLAAIEPLAEGRTEPGAENDVGPLGRILRPHVDDADGRHRSIQDALV